MDVSPAPPIRRKMNKDERKILKFWGPVFLWMALIFILSSISLPYLPKVKIFGIDKLAHILEYLILGVLLVRAFLNSDLKLKVWALIILSITIASLYAASDEWHQEFTPGRTADVFDFLADFIGLNIGVFLYKKRE